jgi:hypothetical protein
MPASVRPWNEPRIVMTPCRYCSNPTLSPTVCRGDDVDALEVGFIKAGGATVQ